ncbi:hypothetical protein CPB84DRAFT_1784388 [Gymnopilus junonius]|uniref:Uncharacterized protein n=1 Tax=Gymnopilus junonius TaxID=109634 RepID=A0A9P5NKL0_GYMJU|nr:hypothetical protein CPB84DRAFT_1784388 [Gymnopilus junonius]
MLINCFDVLVAANVGQHYPVPAPPPHPMHQQSHFTAPERTESKNYDYPQPRNPEQRRLRQLRPPSSDMPSTANHHAGPSSSSFATTQHNYVGYDMPPQSQGPHVRQPGPRSDRFQPYERPRTDDRGRRTQVQPLPSPKCRGSHTQYQTTHGSILHHGETGPRKNDKFDRRDRAGSNSCSKEPFVEQGYPRTSQPSQR